MCVIYLVECGSLFQCVDCVDFVNYNFIGQVRCHCDGKRQQRITQVKSKLNHIRIKKMSSKFSFALQLSPPSPNKTFYD